jgi:hypothetical protein
MSEDDLKFFIMLALTMLGLVIGIAGLVLAALALA